MVQIISLYKLQCEKAKEQKYKKKVIHRLPSRTGEKGEKRGNRFSHGARDILGRRVGELKQVREPVVQRWLNDPRRHLTSPWLSHLSKSEYDPRLPFKKPRSPKNLKKFSVQF